jgi:hypothetical protein
VRLKWPPTISQEDRIWMAGKTSTAWLGFWLGAGLTGALILLVALLHYGWKGMGWLLRLSSYRPVACLLLGLLLLGAYRLLRGRLGRQ